MASNYFDDNDCIQLTIPFHKDYQDFLKYMKAIEQIQQETNTVIQVLEVVCIKGNGQNVEQARQRVSQLNGRVKLAQKENELKMIIDEVSLKENIFRSEILEMKNSFQKQFQDVLHAMEAMKNNFGEIQNKVCLQMAQMSAIIQRDLQHKDLIDYVDLEKFYKSSEYVNCPKYAGEQPLHTACRLGRLDVVQKLIRTGVSFYTKSQSGFTPLHYACFFGHINVVRFLLDLNVPINDQDNAGETALMKASAHGHKAIVELLCTKFAKVHIESKKELTAMMVASGTDKNQVMKILRKYGAEY